MNRLVVICVLVAGVSAAPQFRGVFGNSGYVSPDGKNVQFTREQADNIVLVGPSGVVTRDGKNIQISDDLDLSGRFKRSPQYASSKGSISHAGILRADGTSEVFDHDMAHSILLLGPSGIVTKDGKNYQITDDLKLVGRSKRSAGYVNNKGSIGYSGIVRVDGTIDQFDGDTARNILLIGPSGIVTRDGRNMQLDENLKIINRRYRRHTIGASGMILEDGTPVQFKRAGVEILSEGPSGIILSDGTLVQKKAFY